MSEGLSETDHELRSLLRFASRLGLNGAAVREAYDAVCQEADETGAISDGDRMAEVRRRLINAVG